MLLSLLNSVKLSNENKTSNRWQELSEADKENILLGLKDFEEGELRFRAVLKNFKGE